MTDIVERLHEKRGTSPVTELLDEAAAEIERLRRDNAYLRAQLESGGRLEDTEMHRRALEGK